MGGWLVLLPTKRKNTLAIFLSLSFVLTIVNQMTMIPVEQRENIYMSASAQEYVCAVRDVVQSLYTIHQTNME